MTAESPEHPQPKKCTCCGSVIPDLGDMPTGDLCKRCKDNPVRQEFFKNIKEHANDPLPKHYLTYEAFLDEKGIFKPALVAQYLANEGDFKTDEETQILHYYNGKIWQPNGEEALLKITGLIMGAENRVSHYNNILHDLKCLTQEKTAFSEKIACANGLLDVETRTLTAFNKDELVRFSISTTYNPTALCPNWLEFLSQVVNIEDIPTLQEWSGYLLLPDYRFHYALWIHGDGRNGKGVYDRTMKGILGVQNCSGVGLEELDGTHRFALYQLHGNLYNSSSEPTTNRIFRTEIFQKVTGGDLISAERKGIQKRIEFTNCSKITIIGNKFPKIHDPTTAFKDRMMFIKFPKYFSPENRIPNLESTWLNDPEERSGILNWKLEGLHRLLTQGHFTVSKTQHETEIEFQRTSDSISAFITEMAMYGKQLEVTRLEAYERYKEYCEWIGAIAENDKVFTARMKKTPKVKDSWTRSRGKKERSWKGISFKLLEDEENGTDATLGTYTIPLDNLSNENIEGKEKCVPTVPSVPSSEKPVFGDGEGEAKRYDQKTGIVYCKRIKPNPTRKCESCGLEAVWQMRIPDNPVLTFGCDDHFKESKRSCIENGFSIEYEKQEEPSP